MFGHYRVASRAEPKQLRSTKSYIYYTDDKKGEGATGSVYGGREKKSGERVAVKVFSNVGRQRPDYVQDREFSVLPRLQHSNIVKLLAIDEDSSSNDRVIVMELCAGGSLFNVLDKPENSYGLAELEFLILLRNVTDGMKHLHDKGIVHRDLKPGNIMCCYGADALPEYKLADFGAARELAEDEQYVSIYGTEEYLHPDIYERGVLQKPLVRPFTASADLWSIGVTLYHAATGTLPFRPYGGRSNRATMHQMTTSKASGVISGVQRGSERGPIEWSRELPKTTQMSQGLRHHVEEMLAGLLESDVSKMFSFATFFHIVQSIVNKTVLDVFCVMTSQLIKVYLDPEHSFAEFQEYVALETSLQASQQLHIHEGTIFYPEANLPCRSFPETTPADPVFMFPKAFTCPKALPIAPIIPDVPSVQSKYSLHTDAPATKKCVAAVFALKRKQESLLLIQRLQQRAVKAFTGVIKEECRLLSEPLSRLDVPDRTLSLTLASILGRLRSTRQLANSYQPLANGHSLDVRQVCLSLATLHDEVDLMLTSVQQLSGRRASLSELMGSVNEALVVQNELKKNWDKCSQCLAKDRCLERFDVKFYKLLEIYSDFCRDARERTLPFNQEQIHKIGKVRVNELLPDMVSLVAEHCEANWRKRHSQVMAWCSDAYLLRAKIHQVDQGLGRLISDFSDAELAVSKLGERCRQKVDNDLINVVCLLNQSLHRIDGHNRSPTSDYLGDNELQVQKVYRPPVEIGMICGESADLGAHAVGARQLCDMMTQTEPWTADSCSLRGMACCPSGVHSDPLPSKLVLVPRDLKQGLQEQERESHYRALLADIQRSRDLMQNMEDLSMTPALDNSLDMYGCG